METPKLPKLVEASETTSQEKEEKILFIYFFVSIARRHVVAVKH